MEVRVTTLEALEREVERFAATLTATHDRATVITLSGDLGSGKTTFTQLLGKILGVTEHITSPTFVLAKPYILPEARPFSTLLHLDAYRLEGADALKPTGYFDALKEPTTLIVLEWPENVSDAIPNDALRITLTLNPDGSRTLSYG